MSDDELEQAERLLTWAEVDGMESDEPVCEWCGVVVPGGASEYAPFCCLDCQREGEAADLWAQRKGEGDGED